MSDPINALPGMRWRVIQGLIFLSGAAALIYEILWMRRFAAVFGATSAAIASVLAGMFLGMAIGSYAGGIYAGRTRRPLATYALLEAGTALGALLVEFFLRSYAFIFPSVPSIASPITYAIVMTTVTTIALFLPSFCMGATMPVIISAFAGASRRLGFRAAPLYAANTIGAAAGALSVPFLWLPNFSVSLTYGLCVMGNILICAIAVALDRRVEPAEISRPQSEKRQPQLPWSLLMLFAAVSGASLFILQVTWGRMFAQVHENSIYSFSLVVAVLLIGLSIGVAISKWLLGRGFNPRTLLAFAWIAAGAAVLLIPQLFVWLTDGLSYLPGNWDWFYGFKLLWLNAPTVLIPTVLAGMVLPLVLELGGSATARHGGRVVGAVLTVNTFAAIAGSLLAAFVFPKSLGLWWTFAVVGISMIAMGEFSFGEGKWLRRVTLAVLVAAGLIWWNPASLPRTKVRTDQGEKILTLEESSHGIIAVVERGASRRIKLNNFYVLGGTAATGDERMQAHIPLLLHPQPKRAAFLGIGTGITAGAAMFHPIEKITALEIVPEVIDVARVYFKEANLGLMESPQAEVLPLDARTFLRTAQEKYDVIVGDLFVPWRQGESSLYTARHFQAARDALAPGGLFCQWLPMFQLSEKEFNIIAATFLDVFPGATLWRGDFSPREPALALIGLCEKTKLNAGVVQNRIGQLQPDPFNPLLEHPAGLWLFLVGPLNSAQERFKSAPRHRDDRPWLEILGPRNHAGSSGGDAPLFVGETLERFMREVRSVVFTGTALEGLSDAEKGWQDAGATLSSATILQFQGKEAEAAKLLQQVSLRLPAEIRQFVAPPANQ